MRKIIFGIFTVLMFILFVTSPIQAQNKKIITIKACIDSALINYPSIKASEKIEESKTANSKSLQNQLLPELKWLLRNNVYDCID